MHNKFMNEAIRLAKEAASDGEVPVGCVIVHSGEVIGQGRNRREKNKNALAHAEIEAINAACEKLGGWRLPECTMYVTLEPCPMCAGAIINSRIENVVIALSDAKSGALGSVLNFNSYPLNHKIKLTYGVMQNEVKEILQNFFANIREKRIKMNF